MSKNSPHLEIVKTNRVDQLYTAIGDRVSSITSAEQVYKRTDFIIKPDKIVDHAILFAFLCSALVVTLIYLATGSVTGNGYAIGGFVFSVTGIASYVALMIIATSPQEQEEIKVNFEYQSGSSVEVEQTSIRLEIASDSRINYYDLPMTNKQLVAMCTHLLNGGKVSRNQFIVNEISTKSNYSKLYNSLLVSGLIIAIGNTAQLTGSMETLIAEITSGPA